MEPLDTYVPSNMLASGAPGSHISKEDDAGHPSLEKQNALEQISLKIRSQTRARITSQSSGESCTSLGSAGSGYDLSVYSELSGGFSTAPTSLATTPAGAPIFSDELLQQISPDQTPNKSLLPLDSHPSSRTGPETDYFLPPNNSTRKEKPASICELPPEILVRILSFLTPLERIRCSGVSKSWYLSCFDGQLWTTLDTTDYYRQIPAAALTKLIISAGPFVKDLNLRGCVQLREKWRRRSFTEACTNLEYFSLEGCRIGETPIHLFLQQNSNLVHINLAGLAGATNTTLRLLGKHCQKLEELNISWCHNIDTRGLKSVVEGCPRLRDLRAGEVRGFDDHEFIDQLFRRNTLERLLLPNCHTLTDESLAILMHGIDPDMDVLTERPIVPPRRLKHLDLTHCRGITGVGVGNMVGHVPFLEGLQLSKCPNLADSDLIALLPTCPVLTHLDLDELEVLTRDGLAALADAPCAPHLRHLSLSYCPMISERGGLLEVLKECRNLQSLNVDNTDVTDMTLAAAVSLVRSRNAAAIAAGRLGTPYIGLRIEAYDCHRISWTGIREVLASNAEGIRTADGQAPPLEKEIISLKCFYAWQPTVEEHTKRVLRGHFLAAMRLERKWADWMMANEESSVAGSGSRRRRRRARDAQALHAQEQQGQGRVATRRRHRRSGSSLCVVM